MKTARNNKRIAEAIRRGRKLMGISQRSLADRLGVSHPTILRWERGTEPPASMLERLAVELQMPLHEFNPSYPEGGIPVAITPTDIMETGLLQMHRQLPPKGKRLTALFLETLVFERYRNERSRKNIARMLLEYDDPDPWFSSEKEPDERKPATSVTTLSATIGDLEPAEVELLQAFRRMSNEDRGELLKAVGRSPAKVIPLRPTPTQSSAKSSVEEETVAVRFLLDVAAGIPIESVRQAEEREVPKRLVAEPNMGIVRAVGDSMKDIGIADETLLLCRATMGGFHYSRGDVVVALVGEDESASSLTVKTFGGTHKGTVCLFPENPEHPAIKEPAHRVRIQGVVRYRLTAEGDWVEVARQSVHGRK